MAIGALILAASLLLVPATAVAAVGAVPETPPPSAADGLGLRWSDEQATRDWPVPPVPSLPTLRPRSSSSSHVATFTGRPSRSLTVETRRHVLARETAYDVHVLDDGSEVQPRQRGWTLLRDLDLREAPVLSGVITFAGLALVSDLD